MYFSKIANKLVCLIIEKCSVFCCVIFKSNFAQITLPMLITVIRLFNNSVLLYRGHENKQNFSDILKSNNSLDDCR